MEQEKLETELSEEQKNKLIKSVLIERGRVKDELLSNFDLDGLKKELKRKEEALSTLQDQEQKDSLEGFISIIKSVISELEGGKTAQPEVTPKIPIQPVTTTEIPTPVPTETTPTPTLDIEKRLDDARAKYAEEYKKFLASTGKIARAKRFVFGGKIEDSEIPPELKELEKEYEKATVEYGNAMFSAKKTKNEIFTKVIIEEQIKLNSLKVENLPPKEKNIIRKGLGWYLNPETPRWKKLLVSTALGTAAVYAVSGTTVAAAGGVMYYAGLRLTRATVGAVMGQGANKIFDKLVKDKSSAKRAAEEKTLAEMFKEETLDVSLAKSKGEYAKILERERKAKRDRLITKAILGLAVGAGTSMGMSYGIGHLAHSASDQLHEGNLKTKIDAETPGSIKTESITTDATETIKPEEVPSPAFQNECVTFEKGKGAIQGILDLKHQIREQYNGDYTNMPKSVQDFMNTDATKEAMRLGLFDPEDPSGEESALIQEGSMLKFDKDGNLLFGKPDADGNIPILEKYEGKMFDSDGSRKVLPVENTTESEGMIKMPEEENMRNYQKIVGVESVEKESPENTSLEDISGKEDKTESIRKEIFDKMEQRRPNTIRTGTTIGVGGAVEPGRGQGGANYFWDSRFQNMNMGGPQYYFPGLSPDENDFLNHHPEFANNPFHLDGETLVRALKVHGHNVEHIFKDGDEWENFSNLKAKNWVHFGKIGEDSDPKLIYLNKLATITGTKPRGWTLLYGKAETNGEYVARALQKAAGIGKLDQLKIKE